MNYINEEQTSHDGPGVGEGRERSAFRFTPLPTVALVLGAQRHQRDGSKGLESCSVGHSLSSWGVGSGILFL